MAVHKENKAKRKNFLRNAYPIGRTFALKTYVRLLEKGKSTSYLRCLISHLALHSTSSQNIQHSLHSSCKAASQLAISTRWPHSTILHFLLSSVFHNEPITPIVMVINSFFTSSCHTATLLLIEIETISTNLLQLHQNSTPLSMFSHCNSNSALPVLLICIPRQRCCTLPT